MCIRDREGVRLLDRDLDNKNLAIVMPIVWGKDPVLEDRKHQQNIAQHLPDFLIYLKIAKQESGTAMPNLMEIA